jgi:hypothetical protein
MRVESRNSTNVLRDCQYLAFFGDSVVTIEAIASASRLALMYGLDPEQGSVPIDRMFHAASPEIRKLVQALSNWSLVADGCEVPSLSVYTLNDSGNDPRRFSHKGVPKFFSDNGHRISSAADRCWTIGFDLYYAVMFRSITSKYDLSKDEKQEDVNLEVEESFVGFRTLKIMIPLCRVENKCHNRRPDLVSYYGLFGRMEVDKSEMLQLEPYDNINLENIWKAYLCSSSSIELFYHT